MGVDQRVMRNLKIIKFDSVQNVIFVKGSVPGASGSLVFLEKA
jgi:ribosomal protein L3